MDAAVWGFIGTVVGALVSVMTTMISARNTEKLHRRTAEHDLRIREQQFQRENLLQLQGEINSLVRMVSMTFLADWPALEVHRPDEEIMRQTFRNVALLASRVADESLRSQIATFTSNGAATVNARDAERASDLHNLVVDTGLRLQEEIGAAIRQLGQAPSVQ